MEKGGELWKIGWMTLAFAASVMLSPLLYADSLLEPSDLPRYFLTAILASSALLLAMTTRWQNGIRWTHWHTAGVIVLAWAGFSVFWSPNRGGAYVQWMQFLAAAVCAFVASQEARNKTFAQWIVAGSIAGAAVAALIGDLQNFGIPFFYRDAFVVGSTFYYKNHAALYLDLIAPVAVASVFFVKSRKLRWLVGVAAGLILGYLLMSRTRGSWLALLAVALAAGWLCYRFAWPWRTALRQAAGPLIVALAVASAVAMYPGVISHVWVRSAAKNATLDSSSALRLAMYVDSLPIVREHPLMGTGLDGWGVAFRDHWGGPIKITQNPDIQEQRVHDDPLQFIVELGIPAGLLVIFLLGLPVSRLPRLARDARGGDPLAAIYVAIGLGLLASALHSLVDFPLHKPSSLLQYAIWSGLLVGYSLNAKTLALTRNRRFVIGVGAVAFLAVSVSDYPRFFKGSSLALKAAGVAYRHSTFMVTPPCEYFRNAADRSLALYPEYFAVHMMRVRAYAECARDDDDLIRVMSQELIESPTNVEALLARGHAYLRTGNPNRAESDFRAVIRRFDHDPRAYTGLAAVYRMRGDERGARDLEAKAAALRKRH